LLNLILAVINVKYILTIFLNKKGDKFMEQLLTVKQLAEMLNVEKHTIYQWLKNHKINKIPFYDIGTGQNQLIRFKKDRVMAWLDDCEK